jgi:hypothetical protein
MAIVTCGDLIELALKTAFVNGIGQTAQAEDANDCLSLLQMMLGQWQHKRWLVPSLIDMAITSTGAQSYTIGPQRPDRIQSAYCRILPVAPGTTPVDYPLKIVMAREDYAGLGLKSLSTLPAAVFLDAAWPNGRLYFWPVPPANLYELHVLFLAPLPSYASLTDALNLPPQYIEAALYGLTTRIAMNWGQPVNPAHVAAYRAALATIRQSNLQPAELAMPAGLGSRRGGLAASADPGFQTGWAL